MDIKITTIICIALILAIVTWIGYYTNWLIHGIIVMTQIDFALQQKKRDNNSSKLLQRKARLGMQRRNRLWT